MLEGAQAGLSWSTILRKRENYRRAFAGFDPGKVARFDARRQAALMRDRGHRAQPAENRGDGGQCPRRSLEVQQEFGSLAAYLWQFVGGKPIRERVGGRRAGAGRDRRVATP